MTIYQLFKQYADRLAVEQFDDNGFTTISIRQPNGFYVATVKHPSNLLPQDITLVDKDNDDYPLLKALYAKHSRINAILVTNTENCVAFARHKCDLPPILDDMAEIVGTVAKFAINTKNAVRAVASNNCAFTEKGALCVGTTLFEAYIAASVLEKSCFVYLNAIKVGAPKRIGKLEACLMHYVYRKKYLKKEQIKKMAEMEVDSQ